MQRPKTPAWDKRYPNLSDEERMKEYARVHRMDTAKFKTPDEIKKIENLQPEAYRFVRTLERESGEKSFLRVFYDAQIHPSEAEITAAIKRLVTKVPKVAFVTRHGERDIPEMATVTTVNLRKKKPSVIHLSIKVLTLKKLPSTTLSAKKSIFW